VRLLMNIILKMEVRRCILVAKISSVIQVRDLGQGSVRYRRNE
jgi:hypothetical protein